MNKWLRKSAICTDISFNLWIITPTQLINSVNAEKPSERDTVEETLN